MLRLPQFQVSTPASVEEALIALATPGSRLVAGGTDILPNLKHFLDEPAQLVSLAGVASLRSIEVSEDELIIGAGVTLDELSSHPDVLQYAPSLAQAAGLVASPLIRNSATIGGNINLDTRCRYVNQSGFWRGGIGGGCIKSEGNVCHVVPKGRNCVAAMSSDCVPVAISLGAEFRLVRTGDERRVAAADYFVADGTAHTKREAGELMVAVHIPRVPGKRRATYSKWSVRKSIDFPLVSVATRIDLQSDARDAAIEAMSVVVGVLGAKPRVVSKLDQWQGKSLDDPDLPQGVADLVYKQCKPLENVPFEAEYRRDMLRVYARRSIEQLVAEA